VYGPFSMQAEYIYASVRGAQTISSSSAGTLTLGPPKNASFSGWYAQASYFITGEHRNYNKTASPSDYQATFGRIIPICNFSPLTGGTGAWELAFRVSNLDLDDVAGGFDGGNQTDFTAALNWYLNPNVMVKMNYIYAHVDPHDASNANILNGNTINNNGALTSSGRDSIFGARFQIAF